MKKAMSPLISTIILIAFAVALGGVVMSWGTSATQQGAGCGQASLKLVSYEDGACIKDGTLYVSLYNDGDIALDGVKIGVIGDKMYSNTYYQKIGVAELSKANVEYPVISGVSKVVITPMFFKDSKENYCGQKGFFIDKIGECQ